MKKLIFILLVSIQSFAQGLFEVRTSHEKLGINELLRVDFVMHDDGQNFIAPKFEGFIVKEGPRTNQYEETINGKRRYSLEYSYLLQPQKKGAATIDPATVEISGDTFKTAPVHITITDAVKITGKLQTLELPVHPAYLETDDE
ncbi:MAG TPA: BatD family protein [Flavobacterium sp.]|jgi:hypothetical protein